MLMYMQIVLSLLSSIACLPAHDCSCSATDGDLERLQGRRAPCALLPLLFSLERLSSVRTGPRSAAVTSLWWILATAARVLPQELEGQLVPTGGRRPRSIRRQQDELPARRGHEPMMLWSSTLGQRHQRERVDERRLVQVRVQ
jgi:hypothetical protein